MAGAFFFRQPLAPAHATARGPAARHQHRATSPSSSNTAARAENHEAKAAILHHCAERKRSRSQSPGADSGAGVPTSPALGVNGPGTSTQHHSDHSDMALCVASQGFHTIPPKSTSSIHLHPQTFYTPSEYSERESPLATPPRLSHQGIYNRPRLDQYFRCVRWKQPTPSPV